MALLLTLPEAAVAQPAIPHVFIGTASVNGLPAPAGTAVVAEVDGICTDSVRVGAGGRFSNLLAKGPGSTVTFKIDTLAAAQRFPWTLGGATVLDLTTSSPQSSTVTRNTITSASGPRVPPHVFIGTASVNGLPAPAGTAVVAEVDGICTNSVRVGAGGRFSNLLAKGPGSTVTFKIDTLAAAQRFPWTLGGATVLDLTTESYISLPATALAPLGDNLVRVFKFNNATKTWLFYDPREEFAAVNTLTTLTSGEAYWIKVTRTMTVGMNGGSRSLTCAHGDCWNQIVW